MKRLLIANRGEIALRILRAAREYGLETVAVHTTLDRNLPYLSLADDAVCIDARSYLEPQALVAAALSRGCDAVHPGYGFLSENAAFARLVEDHGLTFVGPRAHDIALMANKPAARHHMKRAGIATLPGSDSEIGELAGASAVADEIGYPVMLKAAHGGGGRGMLVAADELELALRFDEIREHAERLFGNGAVYIEKYLTAPRHIELQIAGDGAGRVLGLGARECSIQRSHQKVVEEAPPPNLSVDELAALREQCCEVLAAASYRNVGTLEFLCQDGAFFFIEMNTRIQVEHPVTEMVTGLDLVRLQLEIAATGELALTQGDVHERGHAIECRINTENEHFVPSPGPVEKLRLPGGPGVRVDTHLAVPYTVPHAYDSLLVKVICHGGDRMQAVARMRRALAEIDIRPIKTNVSLHQRILGDESFVRGEYSTQFLNRSSAGDKRQ